MMFGLFYFGHFFLNTRGFVSDFKNSDRDISTSGLINSLGWILKLLKGCIISKGRLESSTCFCTLDPIDFIHFLYLSYRQEKIGDWDIVL